MNTCKNCLKYQPAKKKIMGNHDLTGTCFERSPPINKVRASGYCKDYQPKQQLCI